MKLLTLYEFIEPKCIMAITIFLILFDNWGRSLKDGFSRWTAIRCCLSLCIFISVCYLGSFMFYLDN